MSPRLKVLSFALLAAFAAGEAGACGVCTDDKVAASYDHAVLTHARERGQVVVFAEPGGVADPAAAMKRVAAAAAHVRGIDPASVRSSAAPASIGFALDTKVARPEQALKTLASAAKVPGLQLATLRVLQ